MGKNDTQAELLGYTANLWPAVLDYASLLYIVDANPAFDYYFLKDNAVLVEEINSAIKRGKTLILFYNISEPLQFGEIKRVHDILPKLNVSADRVYYLTASLDAEKCYNEMCLANNYADRINMVCLMAMPNSIWGLTRQYEPTYKVKEKAKKFLCFNKVLRLQRMALIAKLIVHDLIHTGFVSTYGKDNGDWTTENFVKSLDNIDVRLKFALRRNRDIFPLRLNSAEEESGRPNPIDLAPTDYEFFENSYYSLVTETIFFKDISDPMMGRNPYYYSVAFTEKTFKPIAMKHPFILAGVPGSLKLLRTLGYKTFAPFIDESYDDEHDDVQRLNLIVKEVQRLNELTADQWISWQKSIQPIVEHNFKILADTASFKIGPDLRN